MKYFIIAGEASGDLHASLLISALRNADPKAEFRFLGGDKMASSAGVPPVVHYRDMAYMGFIEVIKHLRQILAIMRRTRRAISEYRPDAVILVDYPSFNLKIAKYAHSMGIPVFYYISPKVWAWKEYRVKEIKQYVSRLYSILPFETEFFKRHGYDISYVGNPTVTEIDAALSEIPQFDVFCRNHSLDPQKHIIALVPGSRRKEIANNLPEMLKAALMFPDYQPVIAGAPSIDSDYYTRVIRSEGSYPIPPVVFNDTFALVRNADAALVTSGTATLETALLGTPQIACYRMNGSRLVYNIYAHILKVKYVTLPNLITDSPLIPELLLHYCNKKTIAELLTHLLSVSPKRDAMLEGYERLRSILGNANGAETTAADIVNRLSSK